MKRFYLTISIALGIIFFSCRNNGGDLLEKGFREVEISISTSGNQTRTSLDGASTDTGEENENTVTELDLLIFDNDGNRYLYRREAVRGSDGTYRATLLESENELTIHLLANSRSQLTTWEREGKMVEENSWEEIQPTLVDSDPERLINSTGDELLPMWGTGKLKFTDSTGPTQMKTVEMLRSVASIDLFVLDGSKTGNEKTKDFILTDLFVYFAANQGLTCAKDETSTSGQCRAVPENMKTSLSSPDTESSKTIRDFKTQNGDYKGIAYQMYVYENNNVAFTESNTDKRPTRVIIAGYYKQTGEEKEWKKSYYPIDIVYGAGDPETNAVAGEYRPLIRNWKYELRVTAVNGPGKPTREDASKAKNTDLGIDIIPWNKDDVEVGVKGQYYVTMERKRAELARIEGSTDKLNLTYRYTDSETNNDFTASFREGDTRNVKNGEVTTIENEWFRVEMTRHPSQGGGTVDFKVIALKKYDSTHNEDWLTVKYRNLEWDILILQRDTDPEGWKNGGDYPILL